MFKLNEGPSGLKFFQVLSNNPCSPNFNIELTKEYMYNTTLSLYHELIDELNTNVRKTKDQYVTP